MDRFISKALVYKKTLVSAVAAGFAIWRMSSAGFTEGETQAAIAVATGVLLVFLARNNDPVV